MPLAGPLFLSAFLLKSTLAQGLPQATETEDENRGGRTAAFVYGGSCSQLANLSRIAIQAVTHKAHAENFYRFCFTQGIYSCSDYSALLRGAGHLEENDSFGCSYHPAQD